ncbi:DMT family transporter [Sphingomonas sp.]|uniref:DMT family transporter n=1 Tax=Sphingomonas sp. TaxID=28214 RepID=UPI002611C7D7|nr:DMT family transporter [Sphingomonas sp.]MDF2493713.1 EamA family transporter [Sphingomonas sp.]
MSASVIARPPGNATARGVACGAAAGALWGLVFLAPALVGEFTPLQLTVGRYLAYGAIAAALIVPQWRRLRATLGRRDWFALAWLALAGNTLYYILLSSAVQRAGIPLTSLVIGFLPVAVTIVGSRDHDAVPLRRLLASLLLGAGAAVAIGSQELDPSTAFLGTHGLIGVACAVGALLCWTIYAVGNARALARRPGISVHDWNLLIGLATGAQALFLLPLALTGTAIAHTIDAWWQFAAVSIGVAVAASIVGNALWNKMSRLLPLTMVGQMILFETLFALLYGFLWEQRWPTGLEIAAALLVTASVLSCIRAHRPR